LIEASNRVAKKNKFFVAYHGEKVTRGEEEELESYMGV
jgi:hypothetical protein